MQKYGFGHGGGKDCETDITVNIDDFMVKNLYKLRYGDAFLFLHYILPWNLELICSDWLFHHLRTLIIYYFLFYGRSQKTCHHLKYTNETFSYNTSLVLGLLIAFGVSSMFRHACENLELHFGLNIWEVFMECWEHLTILSCFVQVLPKSL